MNLPELVGIAGRAGAGKDTLADHLVRQHKYTKYGLATPIKRLLNKQFGWCSKDWEDRKWKEFPILGDSKGASYSPRQLAQWLGTEVGRESFDKNCWVRFLRDEFYNRAGKLVVPDIRFDNEAKAIKELGGVVLQVVRGAAGGGSNHASECGISPRFVDGKLYNDGNVIEYLQKAMTLLSDCQARVEIEK